jgi:hypothetical protein
MFIPAPDFYPSRIPNPTTATKEEGGKIRCPTFLKNMGMGSGIRKKRIPDHGSSRKRAPDPGSGSATPNSATQLHADFLVEVRFLSAGERRKGN